MDEAEFSVAPSYMIGTSYPNGGGEGTPNPGLQRAYRAFWSTNFLLGPWERPDDVGHPERLLDPHEEQLDYMWRCGLLRLSNGQLLGCTSSIVPEGSTDWVALEVAPSSLGRLFQVAYPTHSPANEPWRSLLHEAFIELFQVVHTASPFQMARFGEEAGAIGPKPGNVTAEQLGGGLLLDPQFRASLGPGPQGQTLPSGLVVYR